MLLFFQQLNLLVVQQCPLAFLATSIFVYRFAFSKQTKNKKKQKKRKRKKCVVIVT